MNVVLFGLPTAGKGTQSKMIASEYNIQHISTGDIFRDAMARKTPLGLEIDKLMRDGKLVPDDTTNKIVEQKLLETKNWVLDGYPRSLNQAKLFDKFTKDLKFIYLKISEEEVFVRSILRRNLEGRPEDVSDEVIRKRIGIFNETTKQAIDHFSERSNFYVIDGFAEKYEIFNIIKTILNK